MAKKLYYFNINGFCEHIRYILHYGGVEFEDVRQDREEWYKNKDKGTLPVSKVATYGQLPVYEDGAKGSINQSLAIARYIGQSLNLGGGDPFKDAQLDAIALTIYDLFNKAAPIFETTGTTREALMKTYQNETVDYYLSRFDKQIKENGGFFFGKLTWVDFVLMGVVECIDLFLDTSIEAKYPSVQALISKIHSYPGVKKYVSTRKPYTNPLKK